MKRHKYMKRHKIIAVEAGSIAEELEIGAGDYMLSVNGKEIADVFDYRFLTADYNYTVCIEKQNGEVWELEIEAEEGEELGLVFDGGLMDEPKSCRNRCVFCFIDQNPPGMRETIYFKDDDARLGFLRGNYVTLTNAGGGDLERIITYRFSPVNVSVHAANPELRREMLGSRFAGDVMAKLGKLCEAGIDVNLQIVLCKGINDGAELDRSIDETEALGARAQSLSVVPAGLTKHRHGLYPLQPFTAGDCGRVISQVESWQRKFKKSRGSAFVYAADEFYIRAGRDIPPYKSYEGFPQLENGVGMLALERRSLAEALKRRKHKRDKAGKRYKSVTIVTGMAARGFIESAARDIQEATCCAPIGVCAVANMFFGEGVTVSGLLTGKDIIAALTRHEAPLAGAVLLPKNLLRENTDVLLDDITISEISKELRRDVIAVGSLAETINILSI